MFSFKSFIEAIQGAILSANDALMAKNLSLLNEYFEKDDDDGEIQKRIDQAIENASEVIDPNTKVSKQSLENAINSIKALKTSLSQQDAVEQALASGDLRPKTVILNYPVSSQEGEMVNKEVHVPLITLIPIAFSKVDEVRLKADLELNLIDDELHVGLGKFSNRKKGADTEGENSQHGSVGNVEVVLKPQEMSDGMQHIVDAYEKILKAQLPN